MSKVAVLKTNPGTVIKDYRKLMKLAQYQKALSKRKETILKLNLSWTKYFPACSTQPWQLEGVVKTMQDDGYKKLIPVENKTVVTNPVKGCENNKWKPILKKYGLKFVLLPDVKWVKFRPKHELLKLDKIFPEGILIPKMFHGKQIMHLPTVKTHGHSIMTGSIKNSFGGLLKEVRHYCHKYMHEILVDLMIMQRELHPGIFTAMDGTVAGDGAGPRTMLPKIKNYILASSDSVAIDAISAKMMGFDPMKIPFIKMCHDRGLGTGDPEQIDVVGENISSVNFHFKTKRSLVIWGDQMLRKGPLRFLEYIALHTPLAVWAPLASNIYHEWFWYPTVGKYRINKFMKTSWGELFQKY